MRFPEAFREDNEPESNFVKILRWIMTVIVVLGVIGWIVEWIEH